MLAIPPALRPHVKPFVRYAAIGITNTILDFAIYTSLTRGWSWWRAHYLLANATSFSIVVTWSFFWNKRWAFGDRALQRLPQYVKFVIVTLGGIAITQCILSIGVQIFHLVDLVAKVIAGPPVVVWNFLMYRCWAFRDSRHMESARAMHYGHQAPVNPP